MRNLIVRLLLDHPRLRRWITRRLERDEDIDLHMLGTRYRINTIKEYGYLRAARKIDHSALLRDEVPVLLNLASLLKPGDTFIDAGANIGIYSYTLARLARLHPGITFHAFEANPDTFQRLQTHASIDGINAYNIALSDHAGELDFIGGAVSHVFTTVENTNAYSIPGKLTRVPCRRLDNLSFPGSSLILKIDVEGQESKVLQGAEGLFQTQRIKAVFMDENRDVRVEPFLIGHGFTLLNGHTLEPVSGHLPACLLAIRKTPVIA